MGIGLLLAALGGCTGEAPEVSAQEVIEAACGTLTSTDYKVAATVATNIGTTTFTTIYYGNDYHFHADIKDHEGNLVAQVDQVAKDGIFYSRETVEGSPTTFYEWSRWGPTSSVDHFPCVPAEVTGDSSVSPTPGQASERKITTTLTFPGEATEKRETWVDSNNVPLRGQQTVTPLDGSQGFVVEMTFSNFGTANTITAPDVDSQSGGNAGS